MDPNNRKWLGILFTALGLLVQIPWILCMVKLAAEILYFITVPIGIAGVVAVLIGVYHLVKASKEVITID